jgi:hypothetical protein
MMRLHRHQPTERELAALADGTLPARRRVQVERAVADSPELQANVFAQRQALAAIDRVADERAPAALRARLELMREPRQNASAKRAVRLLPAGALVAAAIALTLVLALGGGLSAPTVAQAAALAKRPALTSAPAAAPRSVTLAGLKAAGLAFPYWGDRFGFHATGVRHDRLDGRAATTVFYSRGAQQIAYTIVSGRPLPVGAPASSAAHNGVWVRALKAQGLRVVTWLRGGHSCVLAGRTVSFTTLRSLASWRGDGRIPY